MWEHVGDDVILYAPTYPYLDRLELIIRREDFPLSQKD